MYCRNLHSMFLVIYDSATMYNTLITADYHILPAILYEAAVKMWNLEFECY